MSTERFVEFASRYYHHAVDKQQRRLTWAQALKEASVPYRAFKQRYEREGDLHNPPCNMNFEETITYAGTKKCVRTVGKSRPPVVKVKPQQVVSLDDLLETGQHATLKDLHDLHARYKDTRARMNHRLLRLKNLRHVDRVTLMSERRHWKEVDTHLRTELERLTRQSDEAHRLEERLRYQLEVQLADAKDTKKVFSEVQLELQRFRDIVQSLQQQLDGAKKNGASDTIVSLERRLQEANTRKGELMRQLEREMAVRTELTATLDSRQKHMNQLNAQMLKVQDQSSAHASRSEQLETQMELLQNRLEESTQRHEASVDSLKQQLASVRSDASVRATHESELIAKLQDAQEAIQLAQQRADTAEARLTAELARMQAQTDQFSMRKAELKTRLAAAIESAQSHGQLHTAEVATLRREIGNLQAKVNAHAERERSLESRLDDVRTKARIQEERATTEMDKLRREIEESSVASVKHVTRESSLEARLAGAEATASIVQKRFTEQLTELEQKLQQSQIEASTHLQREDDLATALAKAHDGLAASEASLGDHIRESKLQVQRLATEKQSLEEQLNTARAVLQSRRTEFEKAESEWVVERQRLTSQVETDQNALEQARVDRQAAESAIRAIDVEKSRLKQDAEQMQATLSELETRMKSSIDLSAVAESKLARQIATSRVELEDARKQIESLQQERILQAAEVQSARGEVRRLELQNSAVQASADTLDSHLRAKVADAEARVDALTRRAATLDEQLKQARVEIDKATTATRQLEAERATQEAQIAQARASHAELEARLQSSEQRSAQEEARLTRMVSESQSRVEEMQKRLKTLELQLRQVEDGASAAASKSTSQMERLQIELSQARSRYAELEAQLESATQLSNFDRMRLTEQAQAAQARSESLESQLQQARATEIQMNNDKKRLQSELDHARMVHSALEKRMQATHQITKTEAALLGIAQTKVDVLTSRAAQMDLDISRLRGQVSITQQQNHDLVQNQAQLTKEMSDLHAQVEAHAQRERDLQTQLDESRVQIEQMKQQHQLDEKSNAHTSNQRLVKAVNQLHEALALQNQLKQQLTEEATAHRAKEAELEAAVSRAVAQQQAGTTTTDSAMIEEHRDRIEELTHQLRAASSKSAALDEEILLKRRHLDQVIEELHSVEHERDSAEARVIELERVVSVRVGEQEVLETNLEKAKQLLNIQSKRSVDAAEKMRESLRVAEQKSATVALDLEKCKSEATQARREQQILRQRLEQSEQALRDQQSAEAELRQNANKEAQSQLRRVEQQARVEQQRSAQLAQQLEEERTQKAQMVNHERQRYQLLQARNAELQNQLARDSRMEDV